MFFILSKTVAFFLLPSNFLIAFGLVGLVLMATRFSRAGIRLVAGSLGLLAVLGFSPLSSVLGHGLESRFPPWDPSRGAPDGIVILGGAISPELSRAYGETAVNANAARVTVIAKLARAYPNARIVYSGGNARVRGGRLAEADFVYPLLESFGIPRERVTLETRSRNTAENAAFTKELLQPKPGERWLLVTSAWHMARSVGCFRQVGFPVEAYPVGWMIGKRVSLWPYAVLSNGLGRLDFFTHEWLGLIAYWLTGRTGELLPGPTPNQ